jgi:hypothetical protein
LIVVRVTLTSDRITLKIVEKLRTLRTITSEHLCYGILATSRLDGVLQLLCESTEDVTLTFICAIANLAKHLRDLGVVRSAASGRVWNCPELGLVSGTSIAVTFKVKTIISLKRKQSGVRIQRALMLGLTVESVSLGAHEASKLVK